jgi:hypothetical protein
LAGGLVIAACGRSFSSAGDDGQGGEGAASGISGAEAGEGQGGADSAATGGTGTTSAAGSDAGGEPSGPDAGRGNEPSVAAYPTAVLEAEPLAYWRMGVASGVSVPDESGNDNPLVLQGGGHELGLEGAIRADDDTAIRFDGESSFAIVTDSSAFAFENAAPFTLEAWALRETGGSSYFQQLYSSMDGVPGNRNGFILYLLPEPQGQDSARSAFEYDRPGTEVGLFGTLPEAGVWAHYAATFDGATVGLYVNGTLVDMASAPAGGITARIVSFTIGRGAEGDGYYFKGVMDELAVYPRALSLLEIATHAALGK